MRWEGAVRASNGHVAKNGAAPDAGARGNKHAMPQVDSVLDHHCMLGVAIRLRCSVQYLIVRVLHVTGKRKVSVNAPAAVTELASLYR